MSTFEPYNRKLQLAGVERQVPPIPQYISKEYLQEEIDDIKALIPEEASSENQLADKAYVDNPPVEEQTEDNP